MTRDQDEQQPNRGRKLGIIAGFLVALVLLIVFTAHRNWVEVRPASGTAAAMGLAPTTTPPAKPN